ncbi:MAG TPA: GNAT family N-acetyltransferase [Rhodanobacteraceae bacterium]
MTVASFQIRPIQSADDSTIARIIRTVMPEFGAGGQGFAIHDAEVDAMHAAYTTPRSAYFVIEHDGEVRGGGGIAPLTGADVNICELRKMYFLPALRGLGAGHALIRHCLDHARNLGFQQCYLETLTGMDAAQTLYRRFGFRPLAAPMGATGHDGCNRWYLLDLG